MYISMNVIGLMVLAYFVEKWFGTCGSTLLILGVLGWVYTNGGFQ